LIAFLKAASMQAGFLAIAQFLQVLGESLSRCLGEAAGRLDQILDQAAKAA